MSFAAATFGQTAYRIEAFAGTDYAGDGRPAVLAPLIQPQGLAIERDGSILVADAADNRIRRISPSGIISTVVSAPLRSPYGVAVGPAGEIYIADLGNGCVRRVGVDGVMQVVAGAAGELQQPRNVVVDAAGAVYISDFGAHKVYKLSPGGALTLVAGTGEAGESGDGGPAIQAKLLAPAGLAIDSAGVLYIADSGNFRVRKVAGGIIESVSEKNGPKIDFGPVTSLAVDRSGRLYTAGGTRIPLVGPEGDLSRIDTLADEVALDAFGRLFTVALRQVRSYSGGVVRILAGNGLGAVAGDGEGPDRWRFYGPRSLVRDQSGNLYIADSWNGRIRRISPDGALATISAGAGHPAFFALDSVSLPYFTDSKSGFVYQIDRMSRLQIFSRGGGSKPFKNPAGLAFDVRGDLFVADTGNGLIRRVTPDGFVSQIAGGGASEDDGLAMNLKLRDPSGVAVAADGAIWFCETSRLRKLTPDGRITSFPEIPLKDARGIRFDTTGRLWIADAAANRILQVSAADGKWRIIAGSGERGYSGDAGPALQAMLDSPTDVWPELDGSILVADSGNNRIRRLVPIPDLALPPDEWNLSILRVLHAATRRTQAVAPGQLVIVESDEPFPNAVTVRVGSESAQVLAADGKTMTALVPRTTPPGVAELSVWNEKRTWGTARIEVAAIAPGIVGAIGNSDGTTNSAENPAQRGSTVTLYVTGEGVGREPVVTADMAGFEAYVVSADRPDDKPGLFRIVLQVPSGYMPSGSHKLRLTIDGVKTFEEATIVCR